MTPTVEKLLEEMAPVIERLVVSQVERVVRQTLAGLAPRDGRDGLPGVPGPPGERGEDGEDGKDGADGKDGRDGKDGEPGARGEDGRAGKDGADGRDGTLEAVTFTREDRDVVVRRSADGAELGRWTTPDVIDRGHYRAGVRYAPGDAVSYGGSLWIAEAATDARPAEGDGSLWRLAVRRGEKGAKGEKGERGDRGERGVQGLPGGRY